MKMVIACKYENIGKIKNMFKNLGRVKGNFPSMKSIHSETDEIEMEYDDELMTMYPNKDFEENFISLVKDSLKNNDIVLVPITNTIVNMCYKCNKIKNFFIYEK